MSYIIPTHPTRCDRARPAPAPAPRREHDRRRSVDVDGTGRSGGVRLREDGRTVITGADVSSGEPKRQTSIARRRSADTTMEGRPPMSTDSNPAPVRRTSTRRRSTGSTETERVPLQLQTPIDEAAGTPDTASIGPVPDRNRDTGERMAGNRLPSAADTAPTPSKDTEPKRRPSIVSGTSPPRLSDTCDTVLANPQDAITTPPPEPRRRASISTTSKPPKPTKPRRSVRFLEDVPTPEPAVPAALLLPTIVVQAQSNDAIPPPPTQAWLAEGEAGTSAVGPPPAPLRAACSAELAASLRLLESAVPSSQPPTQDPPSLPASPRRNSAPPPPRPFVAWSRRTTQSAERADEGLLAECGEHLAEKMVRKTLGTHPHPTPDALKSISRSPPTPTALLPTLLFHVRTLFLFTCDQILDTVLPGTAFSLFATLSGPTLDLPLQPPLAVLSRTPLIALWLWLAILVFCVQNQRGKGSIAEDKTNKPWRPIPAGRVTAAQASRLLWVATGVAAVLSYRLNVLGIFLVYLGLITAYNDYGGGNASGIVRNLFCGAGFSCYFGGALCIAVGPDAVVSPAAWKWTAVITLGVLMTTIQTQEFRDEAGDRARGRRTIVTELGRKWAMWTVVPTVAGWSVYVPVEFFGGNPCRAKKRKCDGGRPACGECVKRHRADPDVEPANLCVDDVSKRGFRKRRNKDGDTGRK
ncbi:hypothetical protein HDU96_002967 [Phlyctochytrium bullatum]|nr:hypothetical protein HDU96_002967 [Phlyctochytrium bullatum]